MDSDITSAGNSCSMIPEGVLMQGNFSNIFGSRNNVQIIIGSTNLGKQIPWYF